MPMLSNQWLAGFFDGEGCINITVAGKHRRCILRLYLVNTNYELLQVIQAQYGGQLTRRDPAKPNWKPFCALIWTNAQAAKLLSVIGRHIILKKGQLELAKRFLDLRNHPERFESSSTAGLPSKEHKFVRRIRQEILAKEENLKAEMHILNRKGPYAIQ